MSPSPALPRGGPLPPATPACSPQARTKGFCLAEFKETIVPRGCSCGVGAPSGTRPGLSGAGGPPSPTLRIAEGHVAEEGPHPWLPHGRREAEAPWVSTSVAPASAFGSLSQPGAEEDKLCAQPGPGAVAGVSLSQHLRAQRVGSCLVTCNL